MKIDENDTNSGKNLKQTIENDLCSRYASLDLQQIHHIAAFVDPHFKDLDPFIPESDREDVRESVKLEMLKLTENDNSEAGAHSGKQASDSQPDPNPPVPPPSKKIKLGSFFSDLTETKTTRKQPDGYDVVKSELDRYCQEPLLRG